MKTESKSDAQVCDWLIMKFGEHTAMDYFAEFCQFDGTASYEFYNYAHNWGKKNKAKKDIKNISAENQWQATPCWYQHTTAGEKYVIIA